VTLPCYAAAIIAPVNTGWRKPTRVNAEAVTCPGPPDFEAFRSMKSI
jgi:hypothetical protein